MPDLIALYSLDQKRRGLSPVTIDKAQRTIFNATNALGFTPTQEQLETFWDSIGISNKSRAAYLSHMRGFFKWAIKHGHLEDNPTVEIAPPKIGKRLPDPLTERELSLMVKNAKPRMLALTLIGSLAGLRCAEMCTVSVEDIQDEVLRVIGKGNKERAIPVHRELAEGLDALGLPDIGLIFPTVAGGQMTENAMSHEIGFYMHRLGIRGGAHRLRHYFGTALFQASQDIRLTAELMGHENIHTTCRYAAADMTKARKHLNLITARKVA